MNFRTLFSSDTTTTGQNETAPLRNSSSETGNYQSTQIMQPTTRPTLTSTTSSTFCTPNMQHVRPLNNYIISSDFSSASPTNDQNINTTTTHNIHNLHQQIVTNNTNQNPHTILPPNILLPETLHYSSSAPSAPFVKSQHFKRNEEYENNTSFAIFNNNNNANNSYIFDEEEDEEISYLDNDIIEQMNIEPSSSPSKSIYTNTPSVIPLVSAFRGISSFSNIIVKPCSEKFDIGVITLTLSQILNYLTLKLFYPFAGFIYPILNITYFEYVLFISLSNLLTFMLFMIQPMFEYFNTNYILFLLQLIIILSQIIFILFSNYSIIYLFIICRMIFIFCLNSIWVQTNGAIRSFTINNIVVNSRRNLLLHSSWIVSTFLLCILGYIWSELNKLQILNNLQINNSLIVFDMILLFLITPTFVFSLLYIILIPSKKLRIKYYDEGSLDVIKRTWSFIMNDISHIIKIKYVNLLIFVNILGAINSMMICFIFGIWIQNLLNLNIVNVAKYTLIQAISELFVMIVNLNKFKIINRKSLCIISIIISIIFIILLFGSTYLALYMCPPYSNYPNTWFCKWLSIIWIDQYENLNQKSMNKFILIICLFGIFFGHETFVTTVNACIFRECRRNNTPNAAYPLWNIIGCGSTFGGQIIVGILWIYCGEIYSMLVILCVMFVIDLVALFTLVYAFRLYKKR